jgi:hypothetical protein
MKFFYFPFIFIALFANFELKSQVLSSQKESFHVSSSNTSISEGELLIYNTALANYNQLDEFRFLNERRIIFFEKNGIYVELYSASELYDRYGKEISQTTISPGQSYLPATFQLINWNDGYAIHPIYEKFNIQTY